MVTEAIADALDQKKPLFILTLDVRKAFDVVCQDSLLRKLHTVSITDSNSWAYMESNLQTSVRVRLQHRYGDSFPVHQGVGQGKIISIHNYAVYINDLLLLLEAPGCGLSISANYLGSPTCADDVVLLANTVIDIQTQMGIVYSYSTRERYHIHPDKSKCITFGMKFPPLVKLNDKEFIPTESLTHLGIDRYSNDQSPDASIDDRLSLGRRLAYALMDSWFHGMNGISPVISIHIYRKYVLPVLCMAWRVPS